MERIHLQKLEITLEDNKALYQIGDYVKGNLNIVHNGVLLLSNVKIGLVCVAEVKWVENPGTRYHRGGHVYHDRRKLLDLSYQIPQEYYGSPVEKGEYDLPFMFQLPNSGLPSSFVSTHGCVTYLIEAIIEEPAIDEIHRTGMEITVEAPFLENLSLSVGGSAEKQIGILGVVESGEVSIYSSISKKGHIRGEMIEIHCTVENMSSADVIPRATLYQTQIFMSGERHKTIETSLSPVIGSKVEARLVNTETLFVLIPEDFSLSIKSALITVKYFVHITLDIPYAFDLHINLPIVITNKHALRSDSTNL